MARHLFGFASFKEYVEYTKCFWPEIFIGMSNMNSISSDYGGSSGDHLSTFEKRTIVKMAFTSNFSN